LWGVQLCIYNKGKTFSLTGWKIGWAVGPKFLVEAVLKHHQFVSYSICHPIQETIAQVLNAMNGYLPKFQQMYRELRDYLVAGLRERGFDLIIPSGTYFILAKVPEHQNDLSYCEELILKNGVATIPTSAFYLESLDGKNYIRFCFAKKQTTLEAALSRL